MFIKICEIKSNFGHDFSSQIIVFNMQSWYSYD